MASYKEFGRPLDEVEISYEQFGRAIDDQAPISPQKKPSRFGQIAKQGAIGTAEGFAGTPGDLLSLIGIRPEGPLPGERGRYAAEHEKPELLPFLSDDDLAPFASGLPSSESVRGLLKLFGVETDPQGVAERTARRVGGNIGAGALTGAGAIGSLGLGAAAVPGQLFEEVAGPWAGLGAELFSLLAPGAFAKKLMPSKAKQPLVEGAKNLGMTEKQIAPLLRSEKATRALGKFAKKGTKSQSYLSDIREGVGDVFENVKQAAVREGPLSPGEVRNISRGIIDIEKNLGKVLPGSDKEKVVKALQQIRSDVINSKFTAADIIDYWQEVNSSINWNAMSGGKKRLAEVKSVFRDALKDVNPQLAKDFDTANHFWGKFKNLEKSLKPSKVDDYVAIQKGLGVIGPVLKGNFSGALTGVKIAVGEDIAQRALLRYMMSPRTQGVIKKAVNLTNQGKINEAQLLLRRLDTEAKEELEAL